MKLRQRGQDRPWLRGDQIGSRQHPPDDQEVRRRDRYAPLAPDLGQRGVDHAAGLARERDMEMLGLKIGVELDRPARESRMPGPRRADEVFVRQGLSPEVRGRLGKAADDGLHLSSPQHVEADCPARMPDEERQAIRRAFAMPRQDGQIDGGCVVGHAENEAAAIRPRVEVGSGVDQAVQLPQRVRDPGRQARCLAGEDHPAVLPDEERIIPDGPEPLQRMAYGRLGHAQPLRGPHDAAFLDQGSEDEKRRDVERSNLKTVHMIYATNELESY